jgi:8-oxo-dGTP pyrophosphatase MutT (NUDIX family)
MLRDDCFYRVSVKALVVDDSGRILLCREDNGNWDIPGGGLDHNEDPIEGLKREIYEETRVPAEKLIIELNPCYFITTQNSSGVQIANVFYRTQILDFSFTPTPECEELKFFSPKEILKMDNVFNNVTKIAKLLI